jgi:predicted nucleic acid-binding protein
MAAALRGTALLEATPTGRAFDQVFSVARQHALTAYDGAYLELSLREGQSLAAIDDDLKHAAVRQAWHSCKENKSPITSAIGTG